MGGAEDIKLVGKFLSPEKSLELRKLMRELESKYNCPVDNHPLVSAKRNELLGKQESGDVADKKRKLLLDVYPVKADDGPAKKRCREDIIDSYDAETNSNTDSEADATIVTDPDSDVDDDDQGDNPEDTDSEADAMIVTDPDSDSDDDSETRIIAEYKPLKKLANVVVQKDIIKVTPIILND